MERRRSLIITGYCMNTIASATLARCANGRTLLTLAHSCVSMAKLSSSYTTRLSIRCGMSEPTTRQGHTRWVTSGHPIPMGANFHMSFDPGERTGWASFDQSGTLTGNGIVQDGIHGLSDFLYGLRERPKIMITETYRIKEFQHGHNLSKVPTIRIIGLLESFAYLAGAKWYEQESSMYKAGMVWAGLTVPAGHVKDNEAAIGHGVYWLHKNGLWDIVL